MHAKTFEELLLEAIDQALSSLGESPKIAIYFHLEKRFGIKKEEIPSQLEDFSDALDKVFGLGAKYLEILVMKNLHKKLNSTQERGNSDWLTPDLSFTMFVKMKKQQFEKSEKTTEWRYYLMQNSKTNSIHDAFVESEEKETKYAGGTPFEKKIIRNFTDLLILKHLQKYPLVSGYEILNFLRQKFDVPFSPGTVYSTIYSLERRGLIKGDGNELGRAYELTDEGGQMIDAAVKARKRVQRLFADILLGE